MTTAADQILDELTAGIEPRPIPPALMAFHMEEAGFGALRIQRLHPAVESMPSLATLPTEFREAFFGALDYAAFGTKL